MSCETHGFIWNSYLHCQGTASTQLTGCLLIYLVSEREVDLKSYLFFRFLFLEFENTILQVTVNNSYNHYLMCLINATEVEDSKLTGNRDFINVVGPQLEYVVPVFSKYFG